MRPHVLASCATSLDGFLDDATPQRLILSGAADLDRVDEERARVDAILVGAGTVRADDPRLLVRSDDRRAARVARGLPASPLRVVLTTRPVDPGARVLLGDAETVLLAGPPRARSSTSWPRRGVVTLMIEGGAGVLRDFLTAGAVDELQLVHAPRLVGDGPRFTGGGPDGHLVETRTLGDDVLLRYRFGRPDDRHLAEACTLAERCPPSATAFSVGCVVVAADGTVLGSGWSRRDDPLDHAEEGVLRRLGDDPRLRSAHPLQLAGALRSSGIAPAPVRGAHRARRHPAGGLRVAGAAGVRRRPVGGRAAHGRRRRGRPGRAVGAAGAQMCAPRP